MEHIRDEVKGFFNKSVVIAILATAIVVFPMGVKYGHSDFTRVTSIIQKSTPAVATTPTTVAPEQGK